MTQKIHEFKLAIGDYTKLAERIACAMYGYNADNIDYTTFDDTEAEVHFSEHEACGCCDTDYTVCIPLDDLLQDIDALIEQKELQRAETARIREKNAKNAKHAADVALIAAEKLQLERLKKKYE